MAASVQILVTCHYLGAEFDPRISERGEALADASHPPHERRRDGHQQQARRKAADGGVPANEPRQQQHDDHNLRAMVW
jgi:hypothetical protein